MATVALACSNLGRRGRRAHGSGWGMPCSGEPAAQQPHRPPLPQPGMAVPATSPCSPPGCGLEPDLSHGGWRKRRRRDCTCKSLGKHAAVLVHVPVLVCAEMGSFGQAGCAWERNAVSLTVLP